MITVESLNHTRFTHKCFLRYGLQTAFIFDKQTRDSGCNVIKSPLLQNTQ